MFCHLKLTIAQLLCFISISSTNLSSVISFQSYQRPFTINSYALLIISDSQVLQWTVRNATSSVFSPPRIGRCNQCMLLCSSSNQSNQLSTHPRHAPAPQTGQQIPELSLPVLIDMGFTDTQAEQILQSVSKARGGGGAAKQCLSTLTALFVLGLNPSSVMKLLMKCPELYTLKESHLQQRISNLRKLGLGEGEIMTFFNDYKSRIHFLCPV